MSSSKQQVNSSGMSLSSALFLIFLVLKLCGVISWSWWWVTAPLWGGFAVLIGFLLFAASMIFLKDARRRNSP